MKLALVASAGGHFFQLYQLRKVWKGQERFWMSFNKPDVSSLIPNEKIYFAYYPESRHAGNAIRNFGLALWIFLKEKPQTVISTGAALAVSCFVAAKLLKIKTVYIEPVDFIQKPSLTGWLIYHLHLANLFLVQHKKQKKLFPRAKYWGSTL